MSGFSPRHLASFTLVEVMIAMTIFITASIVAVSAISSITSFGRTVDRRNQMTIDVQSIFKEMSDDISLSGWAPYDYTSADFSGGYPTDRGMRYYPYVIQQAPTSAAESARAASLADLGGGMQVSSLTWFASANDNWFLRAANGLVDVGRFAKRPDLPPQFGVVGDFAKNFTSTTFTDEAARNKAYRSSYYARSQELIFVRATVGGWSSVPGADRTPIIKFPAGDWTTATLTTTAGTLVKNNHQELGVIRMSEWTLGDANPSATPTSPALDTRNPASFYWSRPSASTTALQQVPVVVNLGAMLSPQSDPSNLVQVRWDSMSDPSSSPINMAATVLDDRHAVIEFPVTLGGTARIKARQLREYMYALIPCSSGSGRLVRAHTELGNYTVVTGRTPEVGDCIGKGTDPLALSTATLGNRKVSLVIDKVYTDNCMRVVFDTSRTLTDGSLKPNQIRVTLYMAMSGTRADDVPITYQASTILTMRILNSSVDNDAITLLLGTTSPGLAH